MTVEPDRPVFELSRLTEYTDEAILHELRRVASVVPNAVITAAVITAHGRVGLKTIRQRFGKLGDALRAAGLAHRSTDVVKIRGGRIAAKMSDEDVLEALRDLAKRLGKTDLIQDEIDEHLPFSSGILRKRWGGLRASLEAAGLHATKQGRRYTEEECFDNMLVVWTHYGRPPMYKEMSQPPSMVGGKAYMLRFGTWNKALAAFVERVNQDRPPEPKATQEPIVQAIVRSPVLSGKIFEDRRDIPLGLRFRVFHRDRFKCVICGDHPARNAECTLHVDHILPWSRGGKTREDNLRTLCETCNVGRGNRFTE